MLKTIMMVSGLVFVAHVVVAAPLFTPVYADGGEGAPILSGLAIRTLDVRVDQTLLRQAAEGGTDPLEFNLFADVTVVGRVTHRTVRNVSSYTLSGVLEGGVAGRFMVSEEQGSMVGHVWLDDGRHFEIGFSAVGQQATREMDDQRALPDADPIVVAGLRPDAVPAGAGDSAAAVGDAASPINVMILYTPAAQAAAGGATAIVAVINQSIDAANLAYTNSGITTRLALAGYAQVSYVETNTSTALSALSGKTDGSMDNIHALRDTNHADMVCLLTSIPSSPYAGIGYLMTSLTTNFGTWAFTVVEWNYAAGYQTFAHELGHNMGCHHAVGDSGNQIGDGVFPYSQGWRFNGTNGIQYRTVMAYAPGNRISYFSNPSVSYRGTPTGTADANNALSINNSAATVANFRQGTPPPLSTNIPTLSEWGMIGLGLLLAGVAARRFARA